MYALVVNDKIKVGPRNWNYNVFEYYMNEEGLDTTDLPRGEPDSAVITGTWKILPVFIDKPGYDDKYDQLAGPFLTINSDNITGYYNIIELPLNIAKERAKNEVAKNRYELEVAGTDHTFADTETVGIYTDRQDRTTYLNAYQTLADGQSITFKFKGGVFKTITKVELGELVATGIAYIQAAFDWEKSKADEIDATSNSTELKAVELRHATQIPEEE